MKNLKLFTLSTLMVTFLLASCEKEVIVDNNTLSTAANPTPNAASINAPADNADQDLPQSVTTFLSEQYPNVAIAKYEVKSNIGGKEFEVKLNNGVEVDFDAEGNWNEIKDPNGVPQALVPEKIRSYVDQNYAGIKIESFNKKSDRNKMKADLLNGVDLEFDMEGKFLRIDK